MKNKSSYKSIINLLLGVAVLLVIWFFAYFIISNSYVLPSPLKVLKSWLLLTFKFSFLKALGATLLRVLIAFFIALILALILAILAYVYPSISEILSVVIGFLRSLPVLAVLLIILVFTARNLAPVIVAILSLIPILYTAVYTSLKGVDDSVIEMANVYKISKKQRVLNIYLPSIKPKLILDGAAGLSFALKLIVSAEIMLNVYLSLGGLIEEAFLYSEIVTLFALTIWVSIIGIIVEFIGKKLSNKAEVKG